MSEAPRSGQQREKCQMALSPLRSAHADERRQFQRPADSVRPVALSLWMGPSPVALRDQPRAARQGTDGRGCLSADSSGAVFSQQSVSCWLNLSDPVAYLWHRSRLCPRGCCIPPWRLLGPSDSSELRQTAGCAGGAGTLAESTAALPALRQGQPLRCERQHEASASVSSGHRPAAAAAAGCVSAEAVQLVPAARSTSCERRGRCQARPASAPVRPSVGECTQPPYPAVPWTRYVTASYQQALAAARLHVSCSPPTSTRSLYNRDGCSADAGASVAI